MTLPRNLPALLSGSKNMNCINVNIPKSLCETDDELKAIYHSKDRVSIWFFAIEQIKIIL